MREREREIWVEETVKIRRGHGQYPRDFRNKNYIRNELVIM